MNPRYLFAVIIIVVFGWSVESDDESSHNPVQELRNWVGSVQSELSPAKMWTAYLYQHDSNMKKQAEAVIEQARSAIGSVNQDGSGNFARRIQRIIDFNNKCLLQKQAMALTATADFSTNFESKEEFSRNFDEVVGSLVSYLKVIEDSAASASAINYTTDMEAVLAVYFAIDQGFSAPFDSSFSTTWREAHQQLFEVLVQQYECQFRIASLARIRTLIEDNKGWLKRSQFGKKAEKFAFYVMHNSSHDLALWEKVLPELEQLASKRETNRFYYPNLYDLVALANNQPQRFGWWLECKTGQVVAMNGLEDVEMVEEYRAAHRMSTFATHVERYSQGTGCSTNTD